MKSKNLIQSSTLLALTLSAPFMFGACSDDGGDTGGDADTTGDMGDGDGDMGDGDGDSGDGDGDSGDGDGDTTGDGDGDTTGDGDGDTDTEGDATGMLRLAHFGVFPNDEGTEVDIFVNGENAGITFAFKDTTGYVELPVGAYDFDVVPTGGTIDDSVFTVEGFEIAEGDMWEVFAFGYVAPEGDEPAFSIGAFPENYADIPEGSNRFNIVHSAALPALNPVDVWAVDENCEPVEPLFQDFEYGTYAADQDLPDVEIKLGFDVGQDATVDACFTIPALGGGALVNAFAVSDSQGGVSIVAHLEDGTNVELVPE